MPKSGLWRFTFTATAFADSYVTDSYTYVYLNVDGERVASSLSNPEGDAYGQFDLSINSIQNLGADQSVTIGRNKTPYLYFVVLHVRTKIQIVRPSKFGMPI